MRITNEVPDNWRDLQDKACKYLNQAGYHAEVAKTIELVRFGGKLTKNVLQNLSDMIRWAARYPLPNNSAKVFRMDDDVPSVCVYGFHVLDVICPIFNYFKSLRKSGVKTD